jgi:flagellar biosynthesis protein FlhG
MRAIAITSGKGGTGKTAISVNLSICLARQGKRVMIFDGDLGLANVDIQLGLSAPFNLSHVVSGERELEDIVVEGPAGVRVLPGASGVVEMEHLSQEMCARLLNGMKRLEQDVDLLVIDTGAGISDNVQFLNAAAEEVVIVMTPDPSALMDAYAMVKILSTRCGHRVVRVIVNQARSADEARQVFERLQRVSLQFVSSRLELLGFVHFDQEMKDSVSQAKPAVVAAPASTSATDLRALAKKWLSLPVEVRNLDGQSFWERILSGNRLGRGPNPVPGA